MASYQSNVKENFLEIMPIQENMYLWSYFHADANVYISQKKSWKRQGNVTKSEKGDTAHTSVRLSDVEMSSVLNQFWRLQWTL